MRSLRRRLQCPRRSLRSRPRRPGRLGRADRRARRRRAGGRVDTGRRAGCGRGSGGREPDLELRRDARRSDRCASLRPAQEGGERAQAGRPDRRARQGRFLRRTLRLGPVHRGCLGARRRDDRAAHHRRGRAAAREHRASRLRAPCRPACALEQRAGARHPRRGLVARRDRPAAADRSSRARHAGRALAGAAHAAGRLVPGRAMHDRGAAPHRRGPGREHRPHPRHRPGRVPALGDAAQPQRARADAALGRPHAHRRQRPTRGAPHPGAARLPRGARSCVPAPRPRCR